ncbi:MAG TPA: DUF2868 domain-containing protein, partial [Actinomycetota bacterium]|nr:DUF2868 domain-containing protein [Actinomycetota bacterium]
MRAIETADASREIWSDADRVWATRMTAEIVGDSAADDTFLGRRATLALKRLVERFPRVQALSRVPSPRRWLAPVVALVALVVGVAGVDVGPAHRINLLAPPVLALLVWNLAVYVALAVAALAPQRLSRR